MQQHTHGNLSPMPCHFLRSSLHQVVGGDRHRIPRHDVLHSPSQDPPRCLRVLRFAAVQRDQAPALLPRQEIERADETHQAAVHLVGALGIFETLDDGGAGNAGLEQLPNGPVDGCVRGEDEEVGQGCHEV